MSNVIRVGFIGAGHNTRKKHLPGFKKISGVELSAVCNATAASTAAVCQEFEIARTYDHWQQIIDDEAIDAVCIGTWPDLHAEITLAALESGKHVLTEARMAANWEQAQAMLNASVSHPELTAMVVPSPFGLIHGDYIQSIIKHLFLGVLREVVVIGANDQFWDFTRFLHPRQIQAKSGINALTLGIMQETVNRWIPPTEQVFAQTTIFEPRRPIESQREQGTVDLPDSIQAVTKIQGGARGLYQFSGVELFGPGLQIHLYGSEGTIKVEFDPADESRERVYTGRHGDKSMTLLELPKDHQGGWQVEADFIAAIRGEKPVSLNDFATACQYMQFTAAVHQSCLQNAPVSLPLNCS